MTEEVESACSISNLFITHVMHVFHYGTLAVTARSTATEISDCHMLL